MTNIQQSYPLIQITNLFISPKHLIMMIFWHPFRNLLNFMNSNRTIPSYTLYTSYIDNNCLSAKTHICGDIGYE